MRKIIISGCNGHMGRVVESICAADPEVEVVAGFDVLGANDREFPVYSSPAQFTGKADAVTVTVEIVEGPGTVNGNSDRESEAMKPDQTWKWTPMSVKLYGVTAATRIAIRSTQQGNPGVTAGEKGYFRWYLDNVKIVKAPRN